MKLRKLNSHDRVGWDRLWLGYQQYYQVDIDRQTTEHTWQKLLNDPLFGCFVIESDQGELAALLHYTLHGHSWTQSPCCYLIDLYVDNNHRRHGHAKRLIDHLIEEAKNNAWDRVYWLTKQDNEQARKLYNQYAPVSDFVRYNVSIA